MLIIRRIIVVAGLLFFYFPLSAQSLKTDNKEANRKLWYLLDVDEDSIPGISLNKAYELLEGRTSKTTLVAIIDSGFDLDHEDLSGNIWINEDEIARNDIDDDGNGFVDDINGWNFIGGENGNVVEDNFEVTREYRRLKKLYVDAEAEPTEAEQTYWNMVKEMYRSDSMEYTLGFVQMESLRESYLRFEKLLEAYLDTEVLSYDSIQNIQSKDSVIDLAKKVMSALILNYEMYNGQYKPEKYRQWLEEGYKYYKSMMGYALNPDFDPRHIVNDDYTDITEKYYGNPQLGDYSGIMGDHGTHVAGIVGAIRNNGLGLDGIADNVKLMLIRAVPNGDERDKDVANSIRYAVDNGAEIINMSFGKYLSPHKEFVYDAIKYAEDNDVLLIHAAGNDALDIDAKPNYPNAFFKKKRKVKNWIEVAASTKNPDESLPAEFSNYGKHSVDIFAPGEDIWSTIPQDQYESNSGTSMAAPVVTGVAALLKSYFPGFSAKDLKKIIIGSSIDYSDKIVFKPGTSTRLEFSELAQNGILVNAYQAVKMAKEKAD
ncbi:MAG TPA: S8 family peptidase [Cyclobacteriaceae bacterium]